jgi:inhibitor of cysteine peptidase
MFSKSTILKRIVCLTAVALFGILTLSQRASIMVHAQENNNNSGSLIKPIKFKDFKEYVNYLKTLDLTMTSGGSLGGEPVDGVNRWESPRVDSESKMPSGESYGETNTQVLGVDEADIIKNDGKFIYILNKNNNKVKIISALPASSMKIAGEINLQSSNDNNYRNYRDMYLKDNKLIIIYTLSQNVFRNAETIPFETQSRTIKGESLNSKIAPNYLSYKIFSCAEVYNISDKLNPKLERTVMSEGNLVSSRMIENTVYLITNKNLNLFYRQNVDTYTKENLLISYSDSKTDTELKYAPIENMYCILDKNNPQNMFNISTISAFDIDNNNEMKITSFTGTGQDMYMSLNNIYLFGQSWDYASSYTDIYKYSIKGTNVKFVACNKVLGTILNQFSADEYKGHLRIATNAWNFGNSIFILDEDLQKTGEILGLAKGEQIKSCRFMGDKGYVVTYKNIDPLFSLNLSNPKSPVVIGELKIPGFSSYLHPISENLIIGIGENTTPLYWRDENGNEIEAGIKQIGIKASLFDVSNESKPVEIKALSIGGPGSYTDIGYDHKSFMYIKDKDLIAIRGTFTRKPINGEEFHEYKSQAILISLKNNSLNIEKILDGNLSYETGNRVTYIGDVLYHFTGSEIVAYRLSDYTKIGIVQYN